jgi:hypothetical protein
MGLMSRLLQRRADRAAAAVPTGQIHEGDTDVLTGLGALISNVSAFQASPGGAEGLRGMMSEAGEMQDEIREIVARHGFDGSAAVAGSEPGDAEAMQREIMEAMTRHGFGVPGQMPATAPATDPGPAQTGPIRDPLSGR